MGFMRSRKLLVALMLALAVPSGLAAQQGAPPVRPQDQVAEQYRIFTAALAAVEQEYVEKIESERLVYGAIEGMLRTLDPHSSFLDPRQYAQMRERQQGQYFGIGVSIVSATGDVTVTSVFENSPAHRAGIRRGDVIAKIKGQDAKGWTNEQAVAELKGPKGTTVQFDVRRPGNDDLLPFTVERNQVDIPTVRAAFLLPGSDNIGYVRVQDFSETTNDELTAALEKLRGQGMKKLMLDLRDNPGGPLDQAIEVSNQFLPRGSMIVYTRGRTPNSDQDFHAEAQGDLKTPLVVLVNRNSASASEIVSGAMQDHDRGLVVGETTFGKALVQSLYRISNQSGLALTTGRYYTPSGRLIQRPWDGSFDEYLTYSLRTQEEAREHNPAELKYTDAGRKVYGGGGIEPDRFFGGPIEGFDPTRFSRMLVGRGLFVGFAERFKAAGDARPGSRSARQDIARGFTVTDQMLADFKAYVVKERVRMDEASFAKDEAFIRAMIRYEIDIDLFGSEEARRNLISADPQARFAQTLFDEAIKLTQLSRNGGSGGAR
jgi:carboxyl-terminal processing protease